MDLYNRVDQVAKEVEGKDIVSLIQDILLKAYGRKSPDGCRFEKSEELSANFYRSKAYSIILVELVIDVVFTFKFNKKRKVTSC